MNPNLNANRRTGGRRYGLFFRFRNRPGPRRYMPQSRRRHHHIGGHFLPSLDPTFITGLGNHTPAGSL
jgi:hypothetical protein